MTVISFPFGQPGHPAALAIFADLQQEYVAPGRAFAVEDAAQSIANCHRWLETARFLKLPIVHFRQIKRQAHFNEASPFAQWIEGFQPRATEILYERDKPSCYANEDFETFLDRVRDPILVIAGLSVDQACLATAIEAHHRQHRAIVLSDCTASASFAGLSASASREVICDVIGRYADVTTLDEFLTLFPALSGTTELQRRRGSI